MSKYMFVVSKKQDNVAGKYLSLLCTYDHFYVNLLRELQQFRRRQAGSRACKIEGDQNPAPQNGFLQFTVHNL